MEGFNCVSPKWLLRVNSTIQGTTHEIPFERLKIEGLNPIDDVLPYEIVKEGTRKISNDAFLSYLGNGYSVPYKFAGRTARLQIQEANFVVFVGKELVCRHEIVPGRGKVSRNKDHFKGLLSEILNQNSASRVKSQNIICFKDPEVEKRPLSFYDNFSEEV